MKGDFKRALSEYDRALTLDPSDSLYGNGRAYIERAKLYLKTGRAEDALKDLNLALEKKYIAACQQVYKIRAETYRKLGKPELAASDQQTADSIKNQSNCPID